MKTKTLLCAVAAAALIASSASVLAQTENLGITITGAGGNCFINSITPISATYDGNYINQANSFDITCTTTPSQMTLYADTGLSPDGSSLRRVDAGGAATNQYMTYQLLNNITLSNWGPSAASPYGDPIIVMAPSGTVNVPYNFTMTGAQAFDAGGTYVDTVVVSFSVP